MLHVMMARRATPTLTAIQLRVWVERVARLPVMTVFKTATRVTLTAAVDVVPVTRARAVCWCQTVPRRSAWRRPVLRQAAPMVSTMARKRVLTAVVSVGRLAQEERVAMAPTTVHPEFATRIRPHVRLRAVKTASTMAKRRTLTAAETIVPRVTLLASVMMIATVSRMFAIRECAPHRVATTGPSTAMKRTSTAAEMIVRPVVTDKLVATTMIAIRWCVMARSALLRPVTMVFSTKVSRISIVAEMPATRAMRDKPARMWRTALQVFAIR